MTNLTLTTPVHDKDMARDFLAGLDPGADRFTFQFFSDGPGRYAEIFHGTLDEVWPKIQALNMPEGGVGVFVTINETDFTGRSSKNIVRARALFADADSDEQITRSMAVIEACGATPSMIVKSGRGLHFYYVCSDIPRDQFSTLQKSLIDKVGTDAAITDLPRVMRLPGTLHLKDPTKPRLVKLHDANLASRYWTCSELVEKLNLPPAERTTKQDRRDVFNLTQAERAHIQKLFAHLPDESLSEGLETDIEEIRSAVTAIPPSVISTEPEWMKLARALAHQAARFPKQSEQLWGILDTASRLAPEYDQEDNRRRFERYKAEALNHENPITIATIFHLAKQHGWQGWSPPLVTSAEAEPSAWSASNLRVSFSNIPHRHWLYGTYLVRGEITVVAAPGGAGKTALATGMAVEIATGMTLLDEKIWGDNLKVLFLNAEDSGIEIARRIWAFCLAQAHNIAGQPPIPPRGLSYVAELVP